MFPLNSSTQAFNINSLTIVNYGLKIPKGSYGSYTSLNSSSKNLSRFFFLHKKRNILIDV